MKKSIRNSSRNSNSRLPIYWSYRDIPFRLFYEIASTGDLSLLLKSGELDANADQNWIKIIQENSAQTQDLTLVHQRNDFQALNFHIAEFILVRAAILKLHFMVDDECLLLLQQRGYKIRASGDTKDFEYNSDLSDALRKSGNIINRVNRKQNEIMLRYKPDDDKNKASYEDIIVELNTALGFVTPRDITLAEYNSYRKVLKQRIKKAS